MAFVLIILVVVSIYQGNQLITLDTELQDFLENQSTAFQQETPKAQLTLEQTEIASVYTDIANTVFKIKDYQSFC